MKRVTLIASTAGVTIASCSAALIRFANNYVAPLFLNSRIERVGEKDLPRSSVEKGGIIYCRMKADDFRFPLPPGSHATSPITISGDFDTVDGTVTVKFDGSGQMKPDEYDRWLAGRLPVGACVGADPVPGGLVISFHYFGDR